MANFNKIILAGRLTRDVELRYTGTGKPVCNGGFAVNRKWTDGNGEKHEETLFIDFTAWNKTAETLNQHTSKGSGLLIEGSLVMQTWEDGDTTRTKHLVIVETFQFLDTPKENEPAKAIRPDRKVKRP